MDKRTFLKTGFCGAACTLMSPGKVLASPPQKPWKWSREAMYQVETPKGIRCQICPNECTLKEGELSDCHNRRVYDGKLHTIAYGNPCSVHIDPMEKKPLYHFLPGNPVLSIATGGCNLRCLNCQNWQISQARPEDLRNYDLPPLQLTTEVFENNIPAIAFSILSSLSFSFKD